MTVLRRRAVGLSLTAQETYAVVLEALPHGELELELGNATPTPPTVVDVLAIPRSPANGGDPGADAAAALAALRSAIGPAPTGATDPEQVVVVCLDRPLLASPTALVEALDVAGWGGARLLAAAEIVPALLGEPRPDISGLLLLPTGGRSLLAVGLAEGQPIASAEFVTAEVPDELRWHPGPLGRSPLDGGTEAALVAFARTHPAVDPDPALVVSPGRGLDLGSPQPAAAATIAFGAALHAFAQGDGSPAPAVDPHREAAHPQATKPEDVGAEDTRAGDTGTEDSVPPTEHDGARTLRSPLLPPGVTLDMAATAPPPSASGRQPLDHDAAYPASATSPAGLPPAADVHLTPGAPPATTARSIRRTRVVAVLAVVATLLVLGGIATVIGRPANGEDTASATTVPVVSSDSGTADLPADGLGTGAIGPVTPTSLIAATQPLTVPSLPSGRATGGGIEVADGGDTTATEPGPKLDPANAGNPAGGADTAAETTDGATAVTASAVTGPPDARYESGRVQIQAAAPDQATAVRWQAFLTQLAGPGNVDRDVPVILDDPGPLRLALADAELFGEDGPRISASGEALISRIVEAATQSGVTSIALGVPQAKQFDGDPESTAVSAARAAALEAAFAARGASVSVQVVDLSRQIGRNAPVVLAITFG